MGSAVKSGFARQGPEQVQSSPLQGHFMWCFLILLSNNVGTERWKSHTQHALHIRVPPAPGSGASSTGSSPIGSTSPKARPFPGTGTAPQRGDILNQAPFPCVAQIPQPFLLLWHCLRWDQGWLAPAEGAASWLSGKFCCSSFWKESSKAELTHSGYLEDEDSEGMCSRDHTTHPDSLQIRHQDTLNHRHSSTPSPALGIFP